MIRRRRQRKRQKSKWLRQEPITWLLVKGMSTLYPKAFHRPTRGFSVQCEQQRTGAARLAESVWCTKFQSSLLNIYFRFSKFQPLLLLIYFREGSNRYSHSTKVWHKTYPICDATLSRSARLRSVTEIAPKSPSLSVNRSPIRYDFCSGAKTIVYSVNIALINKTTILRVHHTFWYISLQSLHHYDVKLPNLKFYGELEQMTKNLDWFLRILVLNSW